MWVAIIVAIIAILLVAFMPKPNIENARAAKLGDFQFPRSKFGDGAPLLWGTCRQKGPITLWFGDYEAVPIKKSYRSGFSKKSAIVGYKNYVGIDVMIALGPGVILRKAWAGNKVFWEGTLSTETSAVIDLPDLFGGQDKQGGLQGTFDFYPGSFDQTRSAYLAAKVDPNIPAYVGASHIVFKHFYIGTTTNLEAFSFEASRLPSGLSDTWSIMPNGLDLNPFEICYDVITQGWGKFGNSEEDLDLPSFLTCAETCYNEGLGMSLMVQNPVTGKDVLEEIMRLADGLLYQDPATDKIVAKLIRNDYDVETLPVLDDSCIESVKNFSKTTWENTFNQCRVTFKSRSSDYNDSVAIAQDFANINFQNRVKSTEVAIPGCTVNEEANVLAARQLSFLNVPLYKCDIVVNRKAQNLRPGGLFILNWAPFDLTQMVMRISKMDFGELTDGKIKISCVQDRFGTQTVLFAPPEDSGFTPVTTEAQPVATRRLWVPPYFLARASDSENVSTFLTAGRLYVNAEAPSGASVNFDALASDDNFVSDLVEDLVDAPYNGSGTLAADYAITVAAESRHDTVGFTVEGVASTEGLSQYSTLAEAIDGSALLLIDDELFVYVGFTDNLDGTVTFDNVYRSVLDTVPAAHIAGTRVWFVNGADGLLASLVPNTQTAYVKLIDETSTAKLDISDAPTVSLLNTTRQKLPLHPNYLTINGSRVDANEMAGATTIPIAWRNRSRERSVIDVYDAASQTLETGVQTRMRWRVGAGAYTTVNTANATENINVSGLTGTLEVLVDHYNIAGNYYSLNADRLTAILLGVSMTLYAEMHFEGADGSTTMTDELGHTFTASGNAQLTTTTPLVGTSSLLLDGTGDFVTGTHADFVIGTGDFRFRAKVRFTARSGNNFVFTFGGGWGVYTFSGSWAVFDGGASNVIGPVGSGVSDGVTYDVELIRSSGILKLFINGVELGSVANTTNHTSNEIRIGAQPSGSGNVNGRIDEFYFEHT